MQEKQEAEPHAKRLLLNKFDEEPKEIFYTKYLAEKGEEPKEIFYSWKPKIIGT